MAETVAVIDRVLVSGSSFPSVVETSTGRRYVLKLSGAGAGKRALATEFVALKLARHLGLNVPDAAILDLPRDFPWQTGTDEFYEVVQRSAGANLGVAFPDAHDLKASEFATLPEEFVALLAAVDALLQNVDRSRANPNIMRDAAGAYWAIDFGACLLIERLARGATRPQLALPPNHFLTGDAGVTYSISEAAAAIDAQCLEATFAALPAAWLDDFGLAEHELLQRLQAYLDAARAI